MSVKDNITSLGIQKSHRCPHCGKTKKLNFSARKNLAECMIANCKGFWALLHCEHCGWVDTLYPIRINGTPCTPQECERLFKEIQKYEEEQAKNERP